MNTPSRRAVAAAALLCLGALASCARACDEDEEDGGEPLPAPPTAPASSGTTEVRVEPDAGTPEPTASVSAAPSGPRPGGPLDPSGIGACCDALRQNAKTAPPEHQGAYLMAAGTCDALRKDPKGRAGLAQVRALVSSAGVPAACK